MSYWDTSTLVKLYTQEPDSPEFERLATNVASPPVTSRIGLYEARATFYRKEAEGIMAQGTAQSTYDELLQDIAASDVRLVELNSTLEVAYGQVLDRCYRHAPPLPIRTLDALHLASARVCGETEIVATDRRLRDAARLLGFSLFPA